MSSFHFKIVLTLHLVPKQETKQNYNNLVIKYQTGTEKKNTNMTSEMYIDYMQRILSMAINYYNFKSYFITTNLFSLKYFKILCVKSRLKRRM